MITHLRTNTVLCPVWYWFAMTNLNERIIFDRRSVRRYEDRPVAQHTLETVLTAALWAPSAHNRTTLAFCRCHFLRSAPRSSRWRWAVVSVLIFAADMSLMYEKMPVFLHAFRVRLALVLGA